MVVAGRRAATRLAPRLVEVGLVVGAVVVAAALGVVSDHGSRAAATVALAGLAAGALVLLAATRFTLFVCAVLVLRSSMDLVRITGRAAGTTSAEGLSRIADPASVLGIVFIAVAGLWLLAQRTVDEPPPRSTLRGPLVALWVAASISVISASNPAASVVDAARLLAALAMFVVLERLMANERTMRLVLASMAASVIAPLATVGVGVLTGSARTEQKGAFARLLGPFHQSNLFGHYLMLVVVFGVAVYPACNRDARRWVGPLVAVSGTCLLLTYTRSAIFGALLGLLVVAAHARPRVLVGVAAVAVVAVLAVPGLADRVSMSTGTSGDPGSGRTLAWRLDYWTEVLPLAKHNPVTGIGFNQTKFETAETKQPHNDFIRVYVETGLVGLTAYLVVLAALVRTGRRAIASASPPSFDHAVAVGYLGCAVAFVAVSFVANVITNVVTLWYFFGLAAAGSAISARRHSVVPPTVVPQ